MSTGISVQCHKKRGTLIKANSEDLDHPVHPHRLNRVIHFQYSDSSGFNVCSCEQGRLFGVRERAMLI